jgi:hypothetical protein
VADLHSLTSSTGNGSQPLSSFLSERKLDDVIDISDRIILEIGESIRRSVEKEFEVGKLYLAKPILISRLTPPTEK